MKLKKLIGISLIILGLICLIEGEAGITGGVISEYVNKSILSFFTLIFIFLGLIILGGGTLEEKIKYNGVIILGGNWKGYPYKHKPVIRRGKEKLDIGLRSIINCVAAGEMYCRGETEKIIINGGKTAGKKYPSEAQAMKDYLLKKYKKIKEEDIIIREEAMDTYAEIDGDLEIAKENKLNKLALVTVDTQLPRCKKYLEVLGEQVDYLSSQKEYKKLNPHYERLNKRFTESFAVKYYERFKEFFLRGLQDIGITKQFTKPLAKWIR